MYIAKNSDIFDHPIFYEAISLLRTLALFPSVSEAYTSMSVEAEGLLACENLTRNDVTKRKRRKEILLHYD